MKMADKVLLGTDTEGADGFEDRLRCFNQDEFRPELFTLAKQWIAGIALQDVTFKE